MSEVVPYRIGQMIRVSDGLWVNAYWLKCVRIERKASTPYVTCQFVGDQEGMLPREVFRGSAKECEKYAEDLAELLSKAGGV
jgi:hypothetical protein